MGLFIRTLKNNAMIHCKELKKDFDTKSEMLRALKQNKDEIIGLKKSRIKTSDNSSYRIKYGIAEKTEGESEKLEIGGVVKVAMNTTNYFDSDQDVLLDGAWSKTAKEQSGKTYHVADHELKMGKIVAYPKDVSISIDTVNWEDLGKSYIGSTEVLTFNSKMTEKTNRDVFLAYRDGEPVEHSIRLRYIKIKLAMNSDEESDKEEKAAWDMYYNKIANKSDVDEYGYFWAVTEAAIYKEGSTVLFGANDATPNITGKEQEPLISTQKDSQPPVGTGNDIDYDFLTQNIFKK